MIDDLLPTNPIEFRDARIAELEKNAAYIEVLQVASVKMKSNLQLAFKTTNMTRNKLKFALKVTEERLKECLHVPRFEEDHSKVLVTLFTALMGEESCDVDPVSNTLKPKADLFKDIEDSIEDSEEGKILKERLAFLKINLAERINEAAINNRGRKLIIGNKDRKRQSSGELLNDRSSSRSKSSSHPSS